MKKLSKIILLPLIVLVLSVNIYAVDSPKIFVNGGELSGQAVYADVNSRVLVPLREIFESLDARVHYDYITKVITGKKGDKTITLTIDRSLAKIGQESVTLDEPARIIDSKTFVPIRFIGESLGASVDWDNEAKIVEITLGEKKQVAYEAPDIKEDTNLGADLPHIVYESYQQVIFYNYMGVFIYDLNKSEMTTALASPIEDDIFIKSQGDQTTQIDFDEANNTLSIYQVGRQSPDYFYKYHIGLDKLYKHPISELVKGEDDHKTNGKMETSDWTVWNLIYTSDLTGEVYYPFRDQEVRLLTKEELAYFNGDTFFNGDAFNIRNQFLSSLYKNPAEINLFELFYCGSGIDETMTEDELGAVMVKRNMTGKIEDFPCPCEKNSRSSIDQILKNHMGITLAQTKKVGLEHFTYLPDYDAYYFFHGDTNYRKNVNFFKGERQGNIIRLFYNSGDRMLTLEEKNGDYLFFANEKAAREDYELIYTPRGDQSIKTLKEKDENLAFTVYSYGGDVSIKIDGKLMPLKDAIQTGKISVEDILAKAKIDMERGIIEGDMFSDGGSLLYKYPTYTLIKFNALDGIEDMYIGKPGMNINDVL